MVITFISKCFYQWVGNWPIFKLKNKNIGMIISSQKYPNDRNFICIIAIDNPRCMMIKTRDYNYHGVVRPSWPWSMVVGFTTIYAISAYQHWWEFESRSGKGVPYYVIKFVSEWFSLGTPVYSTNKSDHHDRTEILLKVQLNTIKQTNNPSVTIELTNFIY